MGELNSFSPRASSSGPSHPSESTSRRWRAATWMHTALLQQMSPALRAEITLAMNTGSKRTSSTGVPRRHHRAHALDKAVDVSRRRKDSRARGLLHWMFIVRKGVAICRQKITTSQVFCIECLSKRARSLASARGDVCVCTPSSATSWWRWPLPDVKAHFRIMSLRKTPTTRSSLTALRTRRSRTMRGRGRSSNMDDRPAFTWTSFEAVRV